MRIVERSFVCQVCTGEDGWLDLYLDRLSANSYYGSRGFAYNRSKAYRHSGMYSEFYLIIKRK